MKLITAAIQKKLEKNYQTQNHEDIVLKLFNASGAQTWLITQIEPDATDSRRKLGPAVCSGC